MNGGTNEPTHPPRLPPMARRALQPALHHTERAAVCLDVAGPRLHGVTAPEQIEVARAHATEVSRILRSWL